MLFAAGLLVASLLIATIAMLIGSLAEDVRAAQSAIGVIVAPLFMMALFVMFIGLPPGAKSYVVAAMPASTPIVVLYSSFKASHSIALASLAFNAAYTVAAVYAMSRLVASERILIGFRLKLRRRGL